MGRGADEHDAWEPEDPDDTDGLEARTPPHPLDRVWLHPSELPSAGRPPGPARGSNRSPDPQPGRHRFALAGAVGALATIVVLAAAGAFDDGGGEARQDAAGLGAATVVPASSLLLAATPGIVTITVHDADGARRLTGVAIRRHAVLAAASAVGDAPDRIEIATSDGRAVAGRLAARDVTTDLALLTAEDALSAATLAERPPATGDATWLVSSAPGGSAPFIASGSIATCDALLADDAGPAFGRFVATNAGAGGDAVGGALVDADGSVTAVVVAPGDRSMTYAVAVDDAVAIAAELERTGAVAHGRLGVEGTDADDRGPTVVSVAPGSPADDAGIRPGDVLLAVDDEPVLTMAELTARVRTERPGTTVSLRLDRSGSIRSVEARLSSTAEQGFRATMVRS